MRNSDNFTLALTLFQILKLTLNFFHLSAGSMHSQPPLTSTESSFALVETAIVALIEILNTVLKVIFY